LIGRDGVTLLTGWARIAAIKKIAATVVNDSTLSAAFGTGFRRTTDVNAAFTGAGSSAGLPRWARSTI
jgi:hypothetical protein